MKKIILIVCFTLTLLVGYAQEWLKVYGQEHYWADPNIINETYDKGYLVEYNFRHGQYTMAQSGLMKIDINGNLLWNKTFGNLYTNADYIQGLDLTPDGGVIICGWTNKLDIESRDIFILKLNACMEAEWCNIYNTPNLIEDGGDIFYSPLENNYTLSLFNHGYDDINKRIYVMRLDSTGQQVWCNLYCTNPDYISEISLGLTYSQVDSTFLIQGLVYAYEDSSGMYAKQPYWSKIDMNGNFIWERYHVPDSSFNYGTTRKELILLNSGSILSPVSTFDFTNVHNSIGKIANLSPSGDFNYLSPIYIPDTMLSITINSTSQYNDSTIILGTQYWVTGNDALGNAVLQKTDTLGNLIQEKILPIDFTGIIFDIEKTYNGSIILTASHDLDDLDFMIIKYNEELEYDSIYTRLFTYDSLCDHVITSGSIELACNIITSLNDEEISAISRLTLLPNPADTYTIVYLPETIASFESQGAFNVTSIRADYIKDLSMQVYDINGNMILNNSWPDNVKEQVLNTSSLNPGMYIIRIISPERLISTGKLVVR